jgi:hypothetical protein
MRSQGKRGNRKYTRLASWKLTPRCFPLLFQQAPSPTVRVSVALADMINAVAYGWPQYENVVS